MPVNPFNSTPEAESRSGSSPLRVVSKVATVP